MKAVLDRRGLRLAEKLLGPQELALFQKRYASSQQAGVQYLATRFAAKEAFSKAIGLGLRSPMNWQSCQVISLTQGKPSFYFSGDLQLWLSQRKLKAHLSLSDEDPHALAFVVVEYTTHLNLSNELTSN